MDRANPVEADKPAGSPGRVALVAVLGWLVPGAGYWLIGQRWRGVAGGIAILFLFVCGLLIGGVRVIDVPGYRDADGVMVTARGQRIPPGMELPEGQRAYWELTKSPMTAVFDKPWYLAQIFAGPITLATSYASLEAAKSYPQPTARLGEIGTLYCAIAGMMNFVLILDAASRAYDGSGKGRAS